MKLKQLFYQIAVVMLLLATITNANAQKISAMTETTIPASQSKIELAHTNGAGGYITRSTKLSNLFNKRGDVWTAGHQFMIRTTNANPGVLMFDTESHDGGARGIVLLGATQGDVVINPSTVGIFQVGQSGNAGGQHYWQYASLPSATFPFGFGHPLGLRAAGTNTVSGGNYFVNEGGFVAFASTNAGSLHVEIRAYSKLPRWLFGNKDPNNPDVPGNEIFRFGTNGLELAAGYKFRGDASALTGISGGGGSGLTTNIVVMSAGQPLVQYFTNGSLSAISTDTDASNYIAAVIAAGAPLTDAQKLAVTKFTVSRKWFGTWTDADVIAPIIGGTAAAHLIMLKGTNTASYNNTPTHSANGVTFNGTDNYVDTGWRPSISSNYSQNSARMVLVIPTASANPTAFGHFASVVSTTGSQKNAGFYRNTATTIDVTGFNSGTGNGATINSASSVLGVMIASRESSTVQKAYFWQNTTAVGSAGLSATGNTTASVGAPSENWHVGARKYEGFADDYYSAYTVSGFESGATCDATKAQQIRDCWAQLQLDLSR